MSTVQLRGVRRSFGSIEAVRDVDLTVGAGRVTALLGPSGCGKTTTLRLVAGFESPDLGEITIGDRVVASAGGAWVAPEARRVGMVFQQLALFPHLDVAGNIAYGLRTWERSARRARVGELLDLVGLAGYERRRTDALSGGQAQRVALARALAPMPDVVLLDEPFSSLDVSLRAELRVEVSRILAEAGVTTMLVTHDQDEALALGDRVAVMLRGEVAQTGSPEDVYRRPATPEVASFLGDANLVDGAVRRGTFESFLGPMAIADGAGAPADGPAWGLVRPEDLDLVDDPDGDATVADVQYFGHDQLVTVATPGADVRVRLHARRRFDVGARVRVVGAGLGVVCFPRG